MSGPAIKSPGQARHAAYKQNTIAAWLLNALAGFMPVGLALSVRAWLLILPRARGRA
jgi:hypothetical protein